jgi:hypothetical protein
LDSRLIDDSGRQIKAEKGWTKLTEMKTAMDVDEDDDEDEDNDMEEVL